MITYVKGVLHSKQPPNVVIEVNGLGYEIACPMTTIYKLPDNGKQITLHTAFIVREDSQQLYGFYDLNSKQLFIDLIKVSGIGAKTAIAILSHMDVNELIQTITNNDIARLSKAPGIGKKTAGRLLIEMQDRIKQYSFADAALQDNGGANSVAGGVNMNISSNLQDAIEALLALGYKNASARSAIMKVSKPEMSSEQIIREALKHIN